MKEKTFRIISLGCRTNRYESDAYYQQLLSLGYIEAAEEEEVDLYIFNTCTVTQKADRESRQLVMRAARRHPKARIVVTGCASQRDKQKFAAIDSVSHVIDNGEKEQLISKLFPDIAQPPPFSLATLPAGHTRAFVKIQDGCDNACSYCIIPRVRGRSRSRPLPVICREVEQLVENGYREVVLTGIHIGGYRDERGHELSQLLRALQGVEGLCRVRLSSIDPHEIREPLLEAIIANTKICRSLHLSLQSGSDKILESMRRKYRTEDFLKTVELCRKIDSHFTFSTDLIVGFPGEEQRDFADSLDFLEIGFVKVHLFPYSQREKTRAIYLPNQVPPKTIFERRRIADLHIREVMRKEREKYVGEELSLLSERERVGEEGAFFLGYSPHFIPIALAKEGGMRSNQLYRVRIIKNLENHLQGRLTQSFKEQYSVERDRTCA